MITQHASLIAADILDDLTFQWEYRARFTYGGFMLQLDFVMTDDWWPVQRPNSMKIVPGRTRCFRRTEAGEVRLQIFLLGHFTSKFPSGTYRAADVPHHSVRSMVVQNCTK